MSAEAEQQQAAPERTTGYESIRDLGDCVRSLIPRGTECVLGIVGFALDTSKGKDKYFIRAKYEVLAPEDYEDYGVFTRDYYLGNTPKPGKGPKATAWHMARTEWCKIQAAVTGTPVPSKTFENPDIQFFFADVASDPSEDPIAFFEEITEKLNTLSNQHFPTRIGVESDKSGDFPPKQTVGSPVYPTEEEFARAGNGQA